MCCRSTAAREVSHLLGGSGSMTVRGMLHPSRTGFVPLPVRCSNSRSFSSISTTEALSPATPHQNPLTERSRAHLLHRRPDSRAVPNTRAPKNPATVDRWTYTPLQHRRNGAKETCGSCEDRLSRYACTLRRTPLPHSRPAISDRSCPPAVAPPPSLGCFTRPRGLLSVRKTRPQSHVAVTDLESSPSMGF